MQKTPAVSAKKIASKTVAARAAPARAKAAAPATKTVTATNVTAKHLAAQLGETHELSKKQAETVMDDVIGLMVAHLRAGDRLRLAGFGILEVKDRPARSGRNPATGATIQIAASRKIAFRPAKELKDAISSASLPTRKR